MRKYFLYLAGLVLVIGIGYVVFDNIRLGKDLKSARAELAAGRAEIEKTLTQVKELEKANSLLVRKEQEYLGRIAGLNSVIEKQDKLIKELEENRPKTPPGCEEVVAHYLIEIEAWKSQYGLMEKKVSEYEGLVGNLRLQLENKDKEIELLKAQVERDDRLLQAQQNFLRDLRREIKMQNTQRAFQYIGTGVIVVLLAFTLISK